MTVPKIGEKFKTIMKWLVLAIGVLSIGVIIYFSESKIDDLTSGLCPVGFWHRGLNWEHCSYSAFSIAKYGVMYFLFSFFSLALFVLVNPATKNALEKYFAPTFLAVPIVYMLISGFSRSATLGFILVSILFSIANFALKQKNA